MACAIDKAISTTIYSLFNDVLLSVQCRYSISKETLVEAIVLLKYCFGHLSKGQTPVELPFNNLDYCLGYLNRYALCHTVMVRRAMIRLFEEGNKIVSQVFSARQLDIVSLGGSSGNDLVGLLSSLSGRFPTIADINISVVDKIKSWEILFLEKIDRLRNGSYGIASQIFKEVNVNTCFVLSDLKNPSQEMELKMKSASVVLLVKVFSNIADSDKAAVLKGVVNMMKKGSLLIYMDTPIKEFDLFKNDLQLIYEFQKKKYVLRPHQTNYDTTVNKGCRAMVQIFMKVNQQTYIKSVL